MIDPQTPAAAEVAALVAEARQKIEAHYPSGARPGGTWANLAWRLTRKLEQVQAERVRAEENQEHFIGDRDRWRQRAEAAEAERDRLREELREAEQRYIRSLPDIDGLRS